MKHLRRISILSILTMGLISNASAYRMCFSSDDPQFKSLFESSDDPDSLQNEGAGELTTVLVDIDPLGAVGDVAWTVHTNSLNVRNIPSTVGSTILGSLPRGTTVTGGYYVITESDEEWLEFEFSPGQLAWVSVTGLNRTHPTNAENIATFTDLPYNREIVNRWWGIPLSYEPTDLAVVPISYTDGRVAELRLEARDAAIALVDASRLAGEEVLVGSPYRSGTTQQAIYQNNVYNSGLNQRFSAPPGHSEHQLGVTVDWVDPDDGRFLTNTDSEYLWMVANAGSFGWRQTYTATNTNETGYIEEPWHWRYIGVTQDVADIWIMY